MNSPKILTVQQTTKILRSAGMSIKGNTLRVGLLQGTFPFGSAVHATKGSGLTQRVFWIWSPLLDQWMAERRLKKGDVFPLQCRQEMTAWLGRDRSGASQ